MNHSAQQKTPAMTFDIAFKRLISHEGGYTDDRRDRGNWTSGVIGKGQCKGTKYGISAMSYPDEDIKNLTLEQAKAIYKRDFWNCYPMDELPVNMHFELFDAGVNHGQTRAIMFLQSALGVADDGDIGPITMAAIKKHMAKPQEVMGTVVASHEELQLSPERLEMRFNAERLDFYTRTYAWNTYSKGWARRVAHNLRHI